MIRTPRDWSPSVIAALAAAAVLLAAGVLMAVYQEQLYSAQQVRAVREQAQILAGSVTAAVVFDDHNAAQEYVDALRVNPELQAAVHVLAAWARLGDAARSALLLPCLFETKALRNFPLARRCCGGA